MRLSGARSAHICPRDLTRGPCTLTALYFKQCFVFFTLLRPFLTILTNFVLPDSSVLLAEDQHGYRSPFQMWQAGFLGTDTNCANYAFETVMWDLLTNNVFLLLVTLYIVGLLSKTLIAAAKSARASAAAKATNESERNVAIKAKQVAPSARVLVRRQLQNAKLSDDPETRKLERGLITFLWLIFVIYFPWAVICFVHQLYLYVTWGDVQNGLASWQDCLLAHDLTATGVGLRDAHWGGSSTEAFAACGEAPPVQPFNVWYMHYCLMLQNIVMGVTFLLLFGINERNAKLCIKCAKASTTCAFLILLLPLCVSLSRVASGIIHGQSHI